MKTLDPIVIHREMKRQIDESQRQEGGTDFRECEWYVDDTDSVYHTAELAEILVASDDRLCVKFGKKLQKKLDNGSMNW